jgi:hypothetical protein
MHHSVGAERYKLAKQNLRALTDAELSEVFASFGRHYWRRTIPAIVVFFVLFGIAFGIKAVVGVVPALFVLAVGGVIGLSGVGYALILAGRQLPVRLEVARRARSEHPPGAH